MQKQFVKCLKFLWYFFIVVSKQNLCHHTIIFISLWRVVRFQEILVINDSFCSQTGQFSYLTETIMRSQYHGDHDPSKLEGKIKIFESFWKKMVMFKTLLEGKHSELKEWIFQKSEIFSISLITSQYFLKSNILRGWWK